jgi:hypothetical protein
LSSASEVLWAKFRSSVSVSHQGHPKSTQLPLKLQTH